MKNPICQKGTRLKFLKLLVYSLIRKHCENILLLSFSIVDFTSSKEKQITNLFIEMNNNYW